MNFDESKMFSYMEERASSIINLMEVNSNDLLESNQNPFLLKKMEALIWTI